MAKTVALNLYELPSAGNGSEITVRSFGDGMDELSEHSNVVSYSVGDIYYELSADGEYYIVSGIGAFSQAQLMIPAEHLGKPVKEIAPSAFEGVNSLYKVFIPKTVTNIGSGAFRYCGNILEVRFDNDYEKGIRVWLLTDNTYTDIRMQYKTGPYASWTEAEIGFEFNQGASQFYSGYIPNNVEYMRFVATHRNSGKTCISADIIYSKISEGTCWETDINLTGKETMDLTKSRTGSVYEAINNHLPSDASLTIGSGAFEKCTSLGSVYTPRRLKTIGSSAFQDCGYLQHFGIVPHNSLESIGLGAFENCTPISMI